MSSTVTVKQGKPSASGEVVDTSAAAVLDILDPRVADAADRDAALLAQDEGRSVEGKQDIAEKATAMTGTTTVADRLNEQSKQRGRKTPERAAKEAARKKAKPAAGKPSKAKAAKPAAKRGTGGGAVPRLTDEWLSAKGKDIKVGDLFKTPTGTTAKCVGRWTKHKASGNVPCITGKIVSGAPDGKKSGDRINCVAAEAVHTK